MHKENTSKQTEAHCFEWSNQPRNPGRGLGATTAIETSQNRKNPTMARFSQEK